MDRGINAKRKGDWLLDHVHCTVYICVDLIIRVNNGYCIFKKQVFNVDAALNLGKV